MNGYKVCRTLRDEGVWTPILMLTAKDGEYDEAEALDTGADDFLSKPFSFVVLARPAAGAHPPRRTPAPDRAHASARLELDPGARRCRRERHRRSDLTAREFALLEYLMRKDGNVASKTEILDQVWGIDFDGDPNVVEVYVGYLRKKIDAAVRRRDDPDRARRGLPALSPMTDEDDRADARRSWWPQTVRVRLDDRRDARVRDHDQPGRVRARAARAQQPRRPDRGDEPGAARRPRRLQVDRGDAPDPEPAAATAASTGRRRRARAATGTPARPRRLRAGAARDRHARPATSRSSRSSRPPTVNRTVDSVTNVLLIVGAR